MTDPLGTNADQIDRLTAASDRFGRSISAALASGIAHGRSFDQILQSLGQRLIALSLKAAMKPLNTALSGAIGTLVSGLGGLGGGSAAAASPSGPVAPQADGGVINAPTWFPLKTGMGLAGEAGPEAILPLARGADGKLGVRAGGGASAAPAQQIVVNVTTPDAESFRRSQAQVAAALTRALSRGQRAL